MDSKQAAAILRDRTGCGNYTLRQVNKAHAAGAEALELLEWLEEHRYTLRPSAVNLGAWECAMGNLNLTVIDDGALNTLRAAKKASGE